MAIILKDKKYSQDIVIDSNKIIGVMGSSYERLFKSLTGKSIYYISQESNYKEKTGLDELNKENGEKEDTKDLINMLIKKLEINDFLGKDINELSSSELRILDYLRMMIKNPRIMIIDEPFLYFDFEMKKKITNLLLEIIKSSSKTIIIGSKDSNIIYSLCQRVLLVKENEFFYGNIKELTKIDLLKKYAINIPEIVQFVNLAQQKDVKIPYSKDIRDLIKDVYKNV